MEFDIYNKLDEKLDILQNTTSIQWMPRYYETGKFEIHAAATKENLEYLKIGNRIVEKRTKTIGYIKYVHSEISKNGMEIEARGEMDELNRRINTKTLIISNVANFIRILLSNNLRGLDLKLDAFEFPDTCTPARETTWAELRETVSELCQEFGLGYKVIKKGDTLNVFTLYKRGVNKLVKFSDDLGNLASQEYLKNIRNYKNYAYIAGEGEGAERKIVELDLSNGGPKYELYVDARNVRKSYTDSEGNEQIYTDEEYGNLLKDYGFNKLLEHQTTDEFSVGIKQSKDLFTLGIDYFMGDIIKTESKKLGILKHFRISGIDYIEEDDAEVELVLSVDNQTEAADLGGTL